MFGYNFLSVIQRMSVVGIIAEIKGNLFVVMFEAPNRGVEFATYQLSDISKFKVIG